MKEFKEYLEQGEIELNTQADRPFPIQSSEDIPGYNDHFLHNTFWSGHTWKAWDAILGQRNKRIGPLIQKLQNKEDLDDNEVRELSLMMGLKLKRVISYFTNIINKKRSVVHFGEAQGSFTDGKQIWLNHAIKNPSDIDVLCGLLMHEISHIRYTNFQVYSDQSMRFYMNWQFYAKYIANSELFSESRIIMYLQKIINVLEDRRIDNIMFSKYQGFRGYYAKMYDFYFYQERTEEEQQKMAELPMLQKYLNNMINLVKPESIDMTLPRMDELLEVISIDRITECKNTRDILFLAEDVWKIIHDVMDDQDNETLEQNNNYLEGLEDERRSFGYTQRGGQLDKQFSDAVKEILEQIASSENCDFYDFTNYEAEDVNFDTCVVLRPKNKFKFNALLEQVNQASYGGTLAEHASDVRAGYTAGYYLCKKLVDRSKVKSTVFPNQKKGKIWKRKLHTAAMDNDSVFYKVYKQQYQKLCINISLDTSPSMQGSRMKNMFFYCGALVRLAKEMRDITVRITTKGVGNDTYYLTYLFDSSYGDKLEDMLARLDNMNYSSGTPEQCLYKFIEREIPKSSSEEQQLFFTFTDGMSTYTPQDDPARYIKKLYRHKQVACRAFYIDGTHSDELIKNFGSKNVRYIDNEDLPALSKELNRLIMDNKFMQEFFV